MNNPRSPARKAASLGSWLLAAAVLSLVAYYFWPAPVTSSTQASAGAAATPGSSADAVANGVAGDQAGAVGAYPSAAASAAGAPPPMALDANGGRILNEAGLPPGPPLPEAKPLPIKAAPGEVIGYSVDAQGVSHPMRAGDLKVVPNSPGTYAVVDMWGDNGYTIVPATKPGPRMTEAELARARERERLGDGAGRR